MVETGLIKEASSVEQVCDAYVAKAESEAWVRPAPGLFGFARTLANGDSDGNDSNAHPYLKRIQIDSAPVSELVATITKDVDRARSGLMIVTEEASNSLKADALDEDTLKAHVISFESALITAQKSRRTFITAFEAASERGEEIEALSFDSALADFDMAIDSARETADQLAQAYSTLAMYDDTKPDQAESA